MATANHDLFGVAGTCASEGASFARPEPAASDDTPAAVREVASQVTHSLDLGLPVLIACDPSLEGVLAATGITYLARAHEGEFRLVTNCHLQPRLGEEVVMAPSTAEPGTIDFARRVLEGFCRHVSARCTHLKPGKCPSSCSSVAVSRLVYACASDDPSMPQAVGRYLRLGFSVGPRVLEMIADERVAAFNDLARSVVGECEHTRQFVRFSHMSDGSFIASFAPKADTIPLVAPHFAQRMGTERFCLVDPSHLVAAFHEEGSRTCSIVRLDRELAQSIGSRRDLADDELYVRAMWQRFYRGTTTPGRDRSQRGYDLRVSWMPKRFWAGLSELDESLTGATPSVPERYQGSKRIAASSHSA